MKYFIASDIHGSAYFCDLLVKAFKTSKADKLVLLGDVLYHGPRNDLPKDYAPKKVIEMLNPLAENIVAIRGNCDAEVDQMVLDFDVMQTYKKLDNFYLTPQMLNDLIKLLSDKTISSKQGKQVFYKSLEMKKEPKQVVSPQPNAQHKHIEKKLHGYR